MASKIPQPPTWPLLGNLLDIDAANAIQSFNRLADEYGKHVQQLCVWVKLTDVS